MTEREQIKPCNTCSELDPYQATSIRKNQEGILAAFVWCLLAPQQGSVARSQADAPAHSPASSCLGQPVFHPPFHFIPDLNSNTQERTLKKPTPLTHALILRPKEAKTP